MSFKQRSLTSLSVKFLRDQSIIVLEFLQEGGRDGEEVNASQSLDLSGLQ